MMNEEDLIRIKHMLDAAEKVIGFTSNANRSDLDKDEKLALALIRLIEVIGEASNSVSSEVKEKHPTIPWRAIAGARNRLVHGYFDVDYDVVWEIARVDIPDLVNKLKIILIR